MQDFLGRLWHWTGSPRCCGQAEAASSIFDSQPTEAEGVLDAWLDGAAEDPAFGYTRDDLAEHLRTGASTFRWLEPMLVTGGRSCLISCGLPAAGAGLTPAATARPWTGWLIPGYEPLRPRSQ
jgi:hypothetical protein